MAEDLKLFGEVGLGYSQLQKDAEQINKLLNEIDKNAKLLGKSFKENKIDPNTAKTIEELSKMCSKLSETKDGGKQAGQAMSNLAQNVNELNEQINKNIETFNKSNAVLSKVKLGSSGIEKQTKELSQSIEKQRKELTKWAKEKSSLIKELSLRDVSQMVVDDYRVANKSGSVNDKAMALNRVGQAMSVVNAQMERNKAKINELSISYENAKKQAEMLTGVSKKLAGANASRVRTEMSSLVKETNKLETQAKRLDKILNFSPAEKATKNTVKSLGMLLGQAYAIRRAFNYINKEVMDFERKSVEVQRIAGYTKREMNDLNKITFDMGENMGLNVNRIQEIEGLWARAGKGGKALVDATRTTALGFNVAEFKEAESAVASLNSIINQMYNGDATKAPEILDALVKVADKTAVRNVNDLVEVVSRAGANAKSLGMNLHELNAASAVVMERMKLTGDILGTQFKTLFAYMGDSKRINNLKKYGVEFTTIGKNGVESMKPFMTMMDQLVGKYRELKSQGNDVKANDMLRQLSGVRNVATLKNLVEGWDTMREKVLLSQNSKGFAEQQNAKMMETYAKKVEQLKVSFQKLVVSIGNNGFLDVMKHVVDGTKTGVEFFAKYNKEIIAFTASVLSLKVAMKGIEGLQTMFSINRLGGLFQFLTDSNYSKGAKVGALLDKIGGTNVFGTREKLSKALEVDSELTNGSANATAPVMGLSSALANLKASVVGFTTNASIALPIIAAFTLAIGGLAVKAYVDKKKKLQILEDFTSGKAKDAIDNIKELKRQLDGITSTEAYKKGDQTALDAYKNVSQDLAKAVGLSYSVNVGNKESMDLYNKSLQATVTLKEREYELNKKIASSEAKIAIKELVDKKNVTPNNSFGDSELFKSMANYQNSLKKIKELQSELNKNPDSNKTKKRLDDALNSSSNYELNLIKVIKKIKEMQEASGTTDEALKKMLEGQNINGTPLFDLFNKFIEQAPEFQNGMDKIGDSTENTNNKAKELSETITQLVNDFNKLTGQTDAIESALKEVYETGHLSDGSVMKLLNADSGMAQYVEKTKDGYVLLSGALEYYKEKQEEANKVTEEAVNAYKEQEHMSTDLNGNPFKSYIKANDVSQNIKDLADTVKDNMGQVQSSFNNGKQSAEEFFQSIKNNKNDAQLKNLISTLDVNQIKTLNGTLAKDLQKKVNDANREFVSGVRDINSYASAIEQAETDALNLYVQINGLHKDSDGMWVNQKNQVDNFATSLSNAIPNIKDSEDALSDLMQVFENNPSMANIFSGENFKIPAEEINKFAKDFTTVMSEIKKNNQGLWKLIVGDIQQKTGISKEEAEKCLTNTNSFIKNQDVAVKSAFSVSFSNLSKSLSLTEAQISQSANRIGSRLAYLASFSKSQLSLTNLASNQLINQAYQNQYFQNGTNFLAHDSSFKTQRFNGSTAGTAMKVYTVGKVQNSNYSPLKNSISAQLMKQAQLTQAMKEQIYQNYEDANSAISKGNSEVGNALNINPFKSENKEVDIPDVVNEKLEDLRHELEMDRISEEQFYSGVKELYDNNVNSLTKHGKQKFEKILKDAKKKANSSIPPYVKVLIDDLDEQLKYGEIDQYTYSSKLDDVARKYKTKLGQKAVKEIEKKISDAKIGGLDKYFKSQIDEFENIIKVSDLAVKKIQAEQSLYEALNMSDTAGMGLQESKINVINNKLYATEALAKKYEAVLRAINEEIKKLDTNSSAYHATLQGLVSKQEEFTNKLSETRIATIELQKQRVEEQMKIYDAMQKKYDDAVGNIEQIESKLVNFINQRNQKIREQMDKNHKARMDSIDDEVKARDKALEKEKKRLQDALEAYRKYTQGKIDSLDKKAEEEDYNKELSKKLKERDELQYRINSLSLDDTSTARGKRIELTKQLADKNNEIEDFQRQHSRKLTKDGLQQQLKDYEDSLGEKQKKLDDNAKHEQELTDNRKKALEDEYRHELEIFDEKMKASSVYAEAKNAILSGYVQNAVGASITIRDAMIQGMREQGQASGILAQKYINDLDAVIRKAREAQQIMGMAGSSARSGSLQQRLGLTDGGYQEYLGNKANQLGFSKSDTEQYIMNKLAWGNASPAERKRIEDANHQLRAKYAGDKRNWNNSNFNKDINGSVLGMDWIMDTGSAMKVGQSGGQFTPLGGNFGRDEARNSATADLGLYNSFSRGSSQAFFDYQRQQFSNGGYNYSQPNLGTWTNNDYYNQYKNQSDLLNKFRKTPSNSSDYNGALGYIRNYKNDIRNSIENDQYNNEFPQGGGDENLRESLMSQARAQDGMPYSQSSSRYSTHRDCSSYVYYAVKNSGLYGGDGFYTGDMIPKLAQYGWQDLGHIPKEQIKRGDIFWIRDGKHNHTEIATQDGTLNSTGAHSAGKPAGPSVWVYDYRILRNPRINGFSSGGIADYTGVAMLHGSKSAPEYIFNAPQFDALGRIISNYISAPSVYGKGVYKNSMGSVPEINIDTLINIEGNADKETVRAIKTQADDILDKLVTGLKMRGVRR